jgi:hypothetical protein
MGENNYKDLNRKELFQLAQMGNSKAIEELEKRPTTDMPYFLV